MSTRVYRLRGWACGENQGTFNYPLAQHKNHQAPTLWKGLDRFNIILGTWLRLTHQDLPSISKLIHKGAFKFQWFDAQLGLRAGPLWWLCRGGFFFWLLPEKSKVSLLLPISSANCVSCASFHDLRSSFCCGLDVFITMLTRFRHRFQWIAYFTSHLSTLILILVNDTTCLLLTHWLDFAVSEGSSDPSCSHLNGSPSCTATFQIA